MITLVGVGHVFDIKEQVRGMILEKVPAMVALELDRDRFRGLLARERGVEGRRGLNLAARFQERIASQFGVMAGEEMIAAAKASKEINAKLVLIDRSMEWVRREIMAQMSFEEKVKIMMSLFAIPFVRKKTVEREMERYEQEGEAYLEQVGDEFPTIKKILLDDRNQHMADALRNIQAQNPDITIMAFVGDGHVAGMERLLADLGPRIVRLAELRKWQPGDSDGVSISYSFNVQG